MHSSLDSAGPHALRPAHSTRLGSPGGRDRDRLSERSKVRHQSTHTCVSHRLRSVPAHCHLSQHCLLLCARRESGSTISAGSGQPLHVHLAHIG